MTRRRSALLLSVLLVLSAIHFGFTDEGQWTPDQIDALNLRRSGLRIPTRQVFNPGGAGIHEAVLLLGGGTGEFVSPDGLIMTNHHVAFGAVARIATTEDDYITDGYYAEDPSMEVPAQGYSARMVERYEDVTDAVLAGVTPSMKGPERDRLVRANSQKVVEAARARTPDLQLIISEFSYGNAYKLVGYQTIRDIRIVYVPPFAIGNFGADTDNWMFPRHTGDFSFLRAYVAPDGSAAGYAEENIPYHPRSWLKTAPKGPEEGEFVFLMGFPGSTMRFTDSYFLQYERESRLPYEITIRGERIDTMTRMAERDRALQIRFAETIKGIANGYKNYQGKVVGIDRREMVTDRRAREAEWMEWVDADPARKALYGNVLADLEELYRGVRASDPIDRTLSELRYSTVQRYASDLYAYLTQMGLPESERASTYRGDRADRMRERLLQGPGDAYLPVEQELYRRSAIRALSLPEGMRLKTFDGIVAGHEMDGFAPVLSAAIAEAFTSSPLLRADGRASLLDASPEEALRTGGLFLQVAAELQPWEERLGARNAERRARLDDLRRLYAGGIMDWLGQRGQTLYPDANRSLRFSYGFVRGYDPEDAVRILPFTHLTGVMQKETGVGEFIVPDPLKDAWRRKDFDRWADASGDVPVNLLTTCDTTGGNSGSPVMNARGELIGINFDRVWEATVNDYGFDPEFGRNISVDMRYIIFVCRTFGADRVVSELGL